MKLLSYNVNGIRAALSKNFIDWLTSANPDVICLQEIKATPEQFDSSIFEKLGYHSFWYPAEKKGYSGVAILSKEEPQNIKYGCGIDDFDKEGRVLQADFKDFSAISVYVPSASNMDRLGFKMDFCEYFLKYIENTEKINPHLIISGDYNICHEAIDIHDPIRNAKVSGFLPQEREWMSRFLTDCNLIDSFRYLVKEPNHYSWWSYRANARANNKGWRIDYNNITKNLLDKLSRAYILPNALHSDHCPVGVELML